MNHNAAKNKKEERGSSPELTPFFIYIILTMLSAFGFYQYYDKALRFSFDYSKYLEWLCSAAEWFANNVYGIEHTYTQRTSTTKITELGTTDGAKIFVDFSDGLVLTVSVLCAIFFWPSHIVKKLIAIAVVATAMVGANIARIAGALWVDLHWPLQFKLGSLLITSAYTGLAFLLFLAWMRFSGRHPMSDSLRNFW